MAETSHIPEIYADFVQIATGNAGFFFGFRAIAPFEAPSSREGESSAEIVPQSPLRAIIRLSNEDAKIFAILLRRSIKNYESDNETIDISPELMQLLTIQNDEW